MIAITIQGLSKRFGDSLVLDQIDLRIEPGEMFFLLGASGCGKTTLLRHIAGFYYPDEGRILFDDQDVSRLPPHRRGTGMVFQSYALWPHLNVAGNVAFGLEELRRPRSEIRRRVEEALASVGMSAFAERKINQLSGGQQQRVALARALVIRPRCLLLDEPLSNLDAKMRLQMRGEIRRVCKESGVTAIYVTHDQKEALSIADRLAILDRGQIAQCGVPREVYRRPHSRAVADFIGECNFIDGHLLAPGPTPGSFRVGTALGEFTGYKADREWMAQEGEAVTLLVRPESWKFFGVGGGIGATANRNSVPGRVTRSIYLGDTAEHEFRPRADGTAPLKISEMNPRLEAVAGDAEIWAHAAPEDVVLLSH
jgi:iron(III) transport system ATP-binding protein